jgi:hypothetical protein
MRERKLILINRRVNFTIESVADAAALAALTVTNAEIGSRLVTQLDTGVMYMASVVGSGADKWVQYYTQADATTSVKGIVELSTIAEVTAGTSTTTVITPAALAASATLAGIHIPSALASRAPSSGLAFTSTAGERAYTASMQALGTDAFTPVIEMEVPSANPSASRGVFALSPAGSWLGANTFGAYISTSGTLVVILSAANDSNFKSATVSGFVSSYGGQRGLLSVVRSGSTLSLYWNNTALTYTESGAGSIPTWAATVNSTYFDVGNLDASSPYANWLGKALIYNRALTSADIAALVSSNCVVAKVDQWGSQTALITGDNSTFASDTGFWTKGGGATIADGVAKLTASPSYISRAAGITTVGKKYRLKLTVVTGSCTVTNLADAPDYSTTLTAGTHVVEFTSRTATTVAIYSTAGSTEIDDVTLTQTGVVTSHQLNDNAGTTAYDQSSNALNLTLSSADLWANPKAAAQSDGVIYATTSTNGNQQILGQICLPTNVKITSWDINVSTGTPTVSLGNASGGTQYLNGATLAAGNNEVTLASKFAATQNLWVASDSTATLKHTIHYQNVNV